MNDRRQRLEPLIESEALRLGFAAIGFATAAPAESMPVFDRWLAAGYCADMDYLKRHRELRADPRVLAPGIRSIIVTALRYPANPAPGRGISTYARGADYHEVIRSKLGTLLDFIRTLAPVTTARICVDSAPILEREWAIRAGIGWRGRQGQIVSPTAGCCLLLGELLLDLELKPSVPVPSQCGDCCRCVDACPSKAIQKDGLVDARKCISYMTIEHKGEFSPEQERSLDETLFGCDMCTAVCPRNRQGEEGVVPELRSRPMPDAAERMKMTPAEFKARFKDTALFRTGLARLQRNASVVSRHWGRSHIADLSSP